MRKKTDSLQTRLDTFKAAFEAGGPPFSASNEVIHDLKRAQAEAIAAAPITGALKAGDEAPTFVLQDAFGSLVDSRELLARGRLIVTFFRGVWCPYGNLEMKAIQDELAAVRGAGAHLVAISPQLPDAGRRLTERLDLRFPVLSDAGNRVADLFGVTYRLPDFLIQTYRSIGRDLTVFNGTDDWTLPIPARFVVERSGEIIYAEVDPDHTRRPDPRELVSLLRSLATLADAA